MFEDTQENRSVTESTARKYNNGSTFSLVFSSQKYEGSSYRIREQCLAYVRSSIFILHGEFLVSRRAPHTFRGKVSST